MKPWSLALVPTLVLTALGCGLGPDLEEGEHPDGILIYMHVDMSDAPCTLDSVVVRQALPKIDKPYFHLRTAEGMAYREGFPPGSYQLTSLGGRAGFWRRFFSGVREFTYSFPAQQGGFRLPESGLHYLGSFKVHAPSGTRGPAELLPAARPTERELLERLLPYAGDTSWASKIRSRIEALPKP